MNVRRGELGRDALDHIACAWLESDQRPRMILGLDATLLWQNAGTRRLLAECPGIDVIHGAIRLCGARQDAQFGAFLKSLDAKNRMLALKFDGEDSFCVFRGSRSSAIEACSIEIRFSSARYPPSLAGLEEAFGLTGSEARAARALYGGQSAREIAEAQSISIDTVRSHIRQLYSKIGVTGREQLFRQLDAFRID